MRGPINAGGTITLTCVWPLCFGSTRPTPTPRSTRWRRRLIGLQGPLFIGRKSCLPSARIFGGWVTDAPNAYAALRAVAPAEARGLLAFWPETEGAAGAYRTTTVTDERNWASGLHGGGRRICEGSLASSRDEA